MVNKKEILCYKTDASRMIGETEKVFFPEKVEDIQNTVLLNTDLVIRGAATGLVGGAVPNNSLIIDMNKMNIVKNFDKIKRTVYAEAGVSVRELNEKLSALGYEFPINPLNQGVSTIGGMIATNASDNREMKYGKMRDWIEEIEFVNGKGEIVKTSKADIMDVCGMEGITGVIVGAKLRVVPKIKRSASVYQSDQIESVLSVARQLKSEREVVAIDFFSKEVSSLLGFPKRYNLIIEFDSDRGKIKDEEYEKLMSLRRNVYSVLLKEGYYNAEDPKLFFDSIKEFVIYFEHNDLPYFGYLGSGDLYVFFRDDQPIKRKELIDYMLKSKIKFGTFGIGALRKDSVDSFDKKIISRVKERHDPHNKFNKNKLIDSEMHEFLAKEKEMEKRIEEREKNENNKREQERAQALRQIEEKRKSILDKIDLIQKKEVEIKNTSEFIKQENYLKNELKNEKPLNQKEEGFYVNKKQREGVDPLVMRSILGNNHSLVKQNTSTSAPLNEREIINRAVGNNFNPKQNKETKEIIEDNGKEREKIDRIMKDKFGFSLK
ncbi:MAG: FAD-binding protein [Candidatus Nanoarchaeia archaeon]